MRDLALLSARAQPPSLAAALAELLSPRLGVKIDPGLWSAKLLPDHLRVRVEVVDRQDKVLCASRDLAEIQRQLHGRQRDVSQHAATVDNGAWRAARAKWEGEPATGWKFGDVPPHLVVSEHHGVPVLAYPGLKAMPAGVAVRLFAAPEEAAAATRGGLRQLLETALRHDLGWLEKDLRALRMIGTLAVTLVKLEALEQDALKMIVRWVCDPERMGRVVRAGELRIPSQPKDPPYRLTEAAFNQALAGAKSDLRGIVPKLGDWLKEAFTLRLALETQLQPYPGMAADLAALLPPDFLARMPFGRVQHLPRYLRGMQARAEKFKRDPVKDAARAKELAPYVAALQRLSGGLALSPAKRGAGTPPPITEEALQDFRWLVEEFRVSLFAQELGTAEPVSAVRLQRALDDLTAGEKGRAPAASPVAPATTKKAAPVKSLGALDQLFRK